MRILPVVFSLLFSVGATSVPGDRALSGVFECGGEDVEFETTVLVDFDGFDDDPSDVTRIDWKSLELLFKRTYNDLSARLCDDELREVLWVTAETNEDGSKIIKRGGDLYTVRFTVHMMCRGCFPDEANLFGPPGLYMRALQDATIAEDGSIAGTGRALKKSKSSKKSKKSKSNKEGKYFKKGKGKGKGGSTESGKDGDGSGGYIDRGGGSCECYSTSAQYRAPTEDEFRMSYDSAIRGLMDGDYRDRRLGGVNVDVVTKVTETIDLGCSDRVEEFSSMVAVEFFGNPMEVTEAERSELEAAFLQVYNGLQAHRCDDPLFRIATLTDIGMQADPDEPQVFMYVFRVDGTCRGFGCSNSLTFFDGASSMSRLLHQDPIDGFGHSRPDSGCGCPVYATDFGAPTVEDFEIRFFVVLQELKNRGLLPNVDASGVVTELPFGPPTLSNSTAPSASPTDDLFQNSTAPSVSPSEAADGTDQPTVSTQPSSLPSSQPSSAPSQAGDTASPSGTPSANPSGLPSLSSAPSGTPSSQNSGQPSGGGGGDDTDAPSQTPSGQPSESGGGGGGDTDEPSQTPSGQPSEPGDGTDSPSQEPSSNPSVSGQPSITPTTSQAPSTSGAPSSAPSAGPSTSSSPTSSSPPSQGPSLSTGPSATPSDQPSIEPTISNAPSVSSAPSELPSSQPSGSPSSEPSGQPSAGPSLSAAPSALPTVEAA